MATLQKFKLLATQCAVAVPTQSPTTSPVIHLRRRKTLRMLLSRTSDHHHPIRRRLPIHDSEEAEAEDPPEKKVRRKLKDLFVSSPPPPPSEEEEKKRSVGKDGGEIGLFAVASGGGRGVSARRGGSGPRRPISATFRYRLLRRAWRPVLIPIPE